MGASSSCPASIPPRWRCWSLAEIGDVHRFASADRMRSGAGLPPRHYASDTVVRRGHVTEQGSKLVRWAVVEAIQRKTALKITEDRIRI
ncbi:transposase [Streptomyces mirabilis]|uniref:transposase n=1 Tax=Streptomyces mirabilis TaxID=68239 RepID=UPI0036B1D0F9